MSRLFPWVSLSLLVLVSFSPESSAWERIPPLAFLRATPPTADGDTPATDDAPRQEEEHQARKALGGPGFYDPKNPDLAHLQQYESAVARLPKDAIGFPDWMRALKEGTIQPRAGLSPRDAMNVLNLDIIMRNTKEMPHVRFPHYSHTLWLDCSNCHPQPFEPRAGTTPITMSDIFRGKYCGMCHDRVAFITFFSCQRCHSVPQPSPAATAPPR